MRGRTTYPQRVAISPANPATRSQSPYAPGARPGTERSSEGLACGLRHFRGHPLPGADSAGNP